MKKMIIYCDRCGRELKKMNHFEVCDWHEHQKKVHNSTMSEYDLCQSCFEKFKDFMKKMPAPAENQ